MALKPEHAAYLYVGAFVDELARAGLRHVSLCPGSRSAPLALRLADHPAFRLWMHLDERSAAFFALGLAKAQRFPVALLCSSGTAAANFMPAIVEAQAARVPLMVLTADRPPELRDTGAPQTIDQIKLYGPYAKWFVEMALPEATVEMLRYARTLAGRAMAESLAEPAGVIHLNFPFREPLVPLAPPEIPTELQTLSVGRANGEPYVRVTTAPRQPDATAIASLRPELSSSPKGLIVAGPQTDPAFPEAVTALSAALGYPILADPLSQVRCGLHEGANVIDAYDAFLRDHTIVERLTPEVILRFGAMPTSKPLMLYLQRHASARQILVDSGGNWNDAARLASDVIHADPTRVCAALASGARGSSDWLEAWRTTQRLTRQAMADQVASFEGLFEGRVFSELAECLPDGATCYVSSSMPVRDLDTFFPTNKRTIRFLSNRGANGIDGVVSSALGASVVSDGPLVLVIGDIAFYHDLNGLLAAKRHALNATIILINNDGGGIFSFLPQAAYPEHFEQLFGTPHGLDFRPVAEMYGADYQQVSNWREFRAALNAGLQASGLNIIEVRTRRDLNVTQHRQVWQAVAAALNQ